MVTIETFRQLALSFPGAIESPHHAITSFRIKKKIFATLNHEHNRCCIKLSLIDQSVFCAFDRSVVYPVDNKWGKQGWTLINLAKVRKSMLKDALGVAYEHVAAGKGNVK